MRRVRSRTSHGDDEPAPVGRHRARPNGSRMAHSSPRPRGRYQRNGPGWISSLSMKAMSVIPGRPGSELIAELPDPPPGGGSVLVEGLLAGICGTDAEILRGGGQPPAGGSRLVIGHESLGRVLEAPADAPVRPGDLVAGVVRRPDPVPCPACAAGRQDFCENGRYTERGIKGLDGYGATRWRVSPQYAVPVPDRLGDLGVLTEPGSVVAKAWEQIDALALRAPRPGSRVRTALITGAGPIGMLAALLGRQRGYQVHVFDRVTAGPKPALVAALGATYHQGPVGALDLRPDVVLECTGAGELVVDLAWLGGLISRRVPLSGWQAGLARQPGDVKVVVDLTQ